MNTVPQPKQIVLRPGTIDATRKQMSVVTYPPSYSGSPLEFPEPKKNLLFHSHNSNPERNSVMSKSGQDLKHMPVQTNVQIEKSKFSTPTSSTLPSTGARPTTQQQHPLRGRQSDKAPEITSVPRITSNPATIVTSKPLGSVYGFTGAQLTSNSNNSNNSNNPPHHHHQQPNFRSSCTFTHIPNSMVQQQNQNPLRSSISGALQGPASCPSSGQQVVSFGYYQSQKGRLDQYKQKTYAQMVNKQPNPEPKDEKEGQKPIEVNAPRQSIIPSEKPVIKTTEKPVENPRQEMSNSLSLPDLSTKPTIQSPHQPQQPLKFKPQQQIHKQPQNVRQKEDTTTTNEHQKGDAFKKDKNIYSPQNLIKKSVKFMPEQPQQRNKCNPTNFAKPKPQTESPRKSIKKTLRRDDFKIGRQLGSGKYGTVYMAQHKLTGLLVALKVFSKRILREQKLQSQFIYQVKLQSYLRHQNLIQLYGYFSQPDHIYLIMQLCCDGHLSNLLHRQKRLPQPEASRIIDQLCSGLDFMHRHDIIHRDLKPENVILHCGVVKICDFGWAAYVHDGLRDTFCGTPLYVSPEVLEGVKYGGEVDLWGVGVMAYEMLVGRVPFRIDCERDLHKIKVRFPEMGISERAKDFIGKLLDKDPNNRIDMDEITNHPFLAEHRSEFTKHL